MIADLKPYPAMKDSGVPWLGKVPANWEVLPNRALFAEIKEREHPDEQMLSVTITKGVIRQKALLQNSSKKDSSNQDKSAYKLVCPGDIAYNKMRAWQGAIGVSNLRGIISPAYVVVRQRKDCVSRYFHHLFRTPQFAKEAERWSYGITSDMWSLRPEHFKMIYCSLPAKGEQIAIVRFLDHADRRIRHYISTKQKLIKLLEEQKQAIIHRAVTRGLDSNVRLKPSGVEWFGDVPEHWEVVRLKEVTTSIEQGWSPQCDAQPASDDEWGVLKVGCVNRDAFDGLKNKKLPPALKPIPALEIRDGDILVSRANTRDLLGLAALAVKPRQRLLLCDKLFRFRARPERAESRFLVYAIRQRTSRAQIETSTNGASDSMQNIGQGVVRNLLLTLP
ncbi:MAG: hypothetical protein A2V62_10930, partial [Nitrospirae bacterium RBG_19FT_COMBO_58_9]